MSGSKAFPQGNTMNGGNVGGMELRDWFAGQALAESYRQVTEEWDNKMVTKPYGATPENWIPKTVAGVSYQIADALLAERDRGR